MSGMSVALIAQQYPPAVGGVERHVAELARGTGCLPPLPERQPASAT